MTSRKISIPTAGVTLEGEFSLPTNTLALVLFAHGSGSSRFSPRNQFVAHTLQNAGIGTLLFDLLTQVEEDQEYFTRHLRFNIPLLARRIVAVARWALREPETRQLPIGLFGSSTGSAAALMAAAELGGAVSAVVSRGGRPDLVGAILDRVATPTLLIVGAKDDVVLQLNQQAFERLAGEKRLEIVPRATHLFEEPGALEHVARIASAWFTDHLHPVEISL